MTTFSYGIFLSELEMEVFEKALGAYADICHEQLKKGNNRYRWHLEQLLEIRSRLFSNRMLSSFRYIPGDPDSERLRDEWAQGRLPKWKCDTEDPQES